MKKFLACLLALVMALSLVACGDDTTADDDAIAAERRHLTTWWDDDGMLTVRGCLPADEGALLLKGDDAREIDAQAWRAWHRNQMQPNQPQSHAQQAQAASKSVASKGGSHAL